jgi:oligopeptide transport system substrate-binding protein
MGSWSCSESTNPAGSAEVLRRGLAGEPSSLDPAEAADNFSFQLIQDLYEGLTIESTGGQILPGVASSWDVDPAGTQYTFHLRNGARWSNGKPVRARDFVFAWRRVLDPARGSLVSDDLRLIAGAAEIMARRLPLSELGVYAPSDDVLVVKLERPAPYLPQILTHSATFPVFSEPSARSHSLESWVSNGPYTLTRWLPGTSIELGKNPNYWDRENVRIAKVR